MKKFNQPLIISTLMVSAIASIVHADAVDVKGKLIQVLNMTIL